MEENISKLLNEAEAFIKEGRLEKALDLLHSSLEEKMDAENLILQFLSRWNKAEKDAVIQLITREEMEVTHANVTKGLLGFIEELRIEVETELDTDIPPGFIPEPPIYEGQKQILLLYAKEDITWLETFNKHVFLLKRQAHLRFVDVHNDIPMSLKERSVYQEKMIDVADKILCLVTPNCMSFAIYPLIEKATAASKLIPLRIEKIDMKGTVLEEIQGLPTNQKFVTEWQDHNTAFVDIANGLRTFFKQLK